MTSPALPTNGAVRTADGRSLRTYASGRGEDLVVFESGLGLSGTCWGGVQERLDAHTIAYDRSGYGGSSPDPEPRTLRRLADDLVTVIDATAHRRLILVGHSWGGPIVRTAAATILARGERVDGLVLVDPSDEHLDVELARVDHAIDTAQRLAMVPLARTKLLAAILRVGLPGMPQPHLARTVATSSHLWAARAAAAELRQVSPDLAALRIAAPEIGTTPVRIITGTRAAPGQRRLRRAMNTVHRAAAAASPDGRLIEASRSGHVIPASEPDVIARTVHTLLA